METSQTTTAQKSLERAISQKAFQMSSSTPCKVWVLGFFCGVCITYLCLVCLTPFRTERFGLFFSSSSGAVSQSWSMIYSDVGTSENYSPAPNFSQRKYISLPKENGTLKNSQGNETLSYEERFLMLYSAWSAILDEVGNIFAGGLQRPNMPQAPHLENCRSSVEANKRFDNRGENGSFPPWTLWKGLLGLDLLRPSFSKGPDRMHFARKGKSEGAYPPWIVGSDEDNFPLTRQVQRDIWIHQHPQNCIDPNLRFLVADWERLPGFGMGAQLAGMAGLLAIAVNEKRILVTNYYNRADHSGCQGSLRSHWSCYFFPETSLECQKRAFDLLRSQEAWKNGIIKVKENYTSKEIWAGRIPRVWGDPWSYLQPTTDIGGNLLMGHHKMDRRWWRAQAIRYLMRFQSEYTCGLLNMARHKAFGLQAAKMVAENLPVAWPKVVNNRSQADIERFVWSNHKPWIPRPLLSMHVRMGDKACEMKVVGFGTYMQLAERIRERFPNLNSIWLSTEMQEVIDKSRSYPNWNFYYTNVTRQIGNMTMATYEASLGRETSTNYPFVNFIMATEADFFIGALGSTWCYLIDGMRNTGGKVMAGYLSVNKDRFW